MVHDVFSLHTGAGCTNTDFPIPIKDYQRYVFGDGDLAYRFGTDLAKAFIAHGPLSGTLQPRSNHNDVNDIAVAIVTGTIPTALHSLRKTFVTCLNRHLVSINAQPAVEIDISGEDDKARLERAGPQPNSTEAYHGDHVRLGSRTLIILGEIRVNHTQEARIETLLRALQIKNTLLFAYLVSLESSSSTSALLPILASIASPSIEVIETIVRSADFTLNASVVEYLLGMVQVDFCRFLRRQDDRFARSLLRYANCGEFQGHEAYMENYKFLVWEVDARESM
jgi:hypothetical protein